MDDAADSDNEEGPGGTAPSRRDRGDPGGGHAHGYDHDDDYDIGDAFGGGGLPPLAQLRAVMRAVSGQQAEFKGLLEKLRSGDPSEQLVALGELSTRLLMANEDTLAGNFQSDRFVKELVPLLQGDGGDNIELMLLACRCLANLMEALPAATANVVYGGAIPALCSKLLEIQYMDLAEQCLSALEKISYEFPAAIVREGGLTACLTYLDFFPTSTQRSAVTTAANCCRNLSEDSFATVRDVMPILEGILNNTDQRVVEQGCVCVSRIVQSFKHSEGKLEELMSVNLLRAILRLLMPGTTNLIGSDIHTMFLQVLAYTAKASPRLSAELFKMNVVDTLYQILTGVSPPNDAEDGSFKIDSVMIMQALIHRPKDQVFETLNVICELLPDVPKEGLHFIDDLFDAGYPGSGRPSLSSRSNESSNETRVKLLEECKQEVRRFAVILLPTLTDVYSSTVNLSVRQKVLTAQLKMLSNLDVDILKEALRPIPFASYLASIFSQHENASLVTYALQATELLLERLESIYRYQFYREGVIAEISRLADRPLSTEDVRMKGISQEPEEHHTADDGSVGSDDGDRPLEDDRHDPDDAETDDEGDQDDDHDHSDNGIDIDVDLDEDEDSDSASSPDRYASSPVPNFDDKITLRAKTFIETHEKATAKTRAIRDKAHQILEDLKKLASEIRACVLEDGKGDCKRLFMQLAAYFDGDAVQSITSYELMTSGVLDILGEVFSAPIDSRHPDPRPAFLEAFMNADAANQRDPASGASPATPFSVLVNKLQDLLSRSEHFEVVTVHQQSYDGRASAASMLGKQMRLKLVADEDSGIPKTYRTIMVSIHAIANFKTLDDYLRPRISLVEQPRRSRHRDSLAAIAAALGESGSPVPPPPRTPTESTNRPGSRKSPKAKAAPSAADTQAGPSSASNQKPRPSSRRQQAQPPPPPPPPVPIATSNQEPVECADEERLSDGDSAADNSTLKAIMDELDDELEDELGHNAPVVDDAPDPSAVSVEVASSGKVTARKEDGTKISTPVQGQTPARASPPERSQSRGGLSSLLGGSLRQALGNAGGAQSYAAALQAVPQDWHIEFSVNDRPISHDTTIYKAVHYGQARASEPNNRTVWSSIHTIKFKKVSGPPPKESRPSSSSSDSSHAGISSMPQSLSQYPRTSSILTLLRILHELNSNLDDVLSESEVREQIKLNEEPLSQFVNTKLTAKLNRQLEEPLIVASRCLPDWSRDLARLFPFLFPFESRHLLLQCTSFGYARSMQRWQNNQSTNDSRHDRHREDRPFPGKVVRQKVRIARDRILESAKRVMQLYGSSSSMLEVEYFNEEGTGLGPTLEFYSSVSKEFAKKKLKLWRENDSAAKDEFAFGKQGLFPAPMSAKQAESEDGKKVLELFQMLGMFVARAMFDSRIVDVSFNPTFFRLGDGSAAVTPSLGSIKAVDADLARSLKLIKRFANAKHRVEQDESLNEAQKAQALRDIRIDGGRIEDLGLDFTLPGYDHIELIDNGAQEWLTINNVDLYLEKVLDYTLGSGVQRQVDAFREGFSKVFPYSALRAFTPDELVMLFGRVEEDWSMESEYPPQPHEAIGALIDSSPNGFHQSRPRLQPR
jgi:E3 ubiquitin-protein ligase TRIP12